MAVTVYLKAISRDFAGSIGLGLPDVVLSVTANSRDDSLLGILTNLARNPLKIRLDVHLLFCWEVIDHFGLEGECSAVTDIVSTFEFSVWRGVVLSEVVL